MNPEDSERLIRVEAELKEVHHKINLHLERHYQTTRTALLAVAAALVSVFLAIFK